MAKRKGGGFGTTLILALVLVLVSVTLGVGIARFDFMARMPVVGPWIFEDQPAKTTTSPVVVEGIQDLDQLATVRWRESAVITRQSGGSQFEQFFTGEKVLLVAAGDVEAGVDLSKIGRDDVRVNGDEVTIRLPDPEILSASLDEDKTRIYDRDFGLLNFHPDDDLVEEARGKAEEKVEAAARDNGVLDQAENNAEDSIRAFVKSLGFREVRFPG